MSLAGLSLALGAVIAWLVISESEYCHQALAGVIPLRNSFNSVLFVLVRMFTNPSVNVEYPIHVAGLLIIVFFSKIS